jgi:DNA-3-methyladenine glycosylase II
MHLDLLLNYYELYDNVFYTKSTVKSKNLLMTEPEYWQQSKEFLSNVDPNLARLFLEHPDYSISSRGEALETLLRSIVGQQISVQAAASVWGKLANKVEQIKPENVLSISFEDLKSCGLSKQKAQYIINICNHFMAFSIKGHSYWEGRSFKSIYEELITIKGVGPWTAEMFGMFYLLEKDIFPIKDVGIIRAINRLYGNGAFLSIEKIIAISDKWKPYRSVACWFLWKSIDSEDVQY